ncbi:MAG: hypothetical protein ACTXOO_04880 [Sodalis sp. (in: enterobacteria)]
MAQEKISSLEFYMIHKEARYFITILEEKEGVIRLEAARSTGSFHSA